MEPLESNVSFDIVIIGGGISGLTAAYYLGKRGYSVNLVECGHRLGGLASSFEFDGQLSERYYHFICKTDHDYLEFLDDLGIGDRLCWETGITSFFYNGQMHQFSTPFDLIKFKPIPFLGRLRFGWNIIQNKYRKSWKELDKKPARDWLIERVGQETYNVIWDPLLRIKFGDYHTDISAAWIWHRTHRVASSREKLWEPERFGYIIGGTQTLIDAIKAQLMQMPNVTIRLNKKVEMIQSTERGVQGVLLCSGERISCSALVSTIALNQLKHLVDNIDYAKRLEKYKYIGVTCGLFKLKNSVTNSFWVNINDKRIHFNGIIEYTNLNSYIQMEHQAHYVYIPYYLDQSHPRFKYSDETLMSEYIEGLKLINSHFDESWILAANISRSSTAQAICNVGFLDDQPKMDTPIRGLYITDSTLYYPEDRTISASIRLGKRVASLAAF